MRKMKEQLKWMLKAFLLSNAFPCILSSLVESDICTSSESLYPVIGSRCPKVPYQAAVGEARGIIYSGTGLFNQILITDNGQHLTFANAEARIMTRLLQQYLLSLSGSISRFTGRAPLKVWHAWSDQVTDDTRMLRLYHEGRAAKISATGLTASQLFYFSVKEGFGWVLYASTEHVIVAVEELCTQPIDLGIWLDSSGSLSYWDYQRSKNFVVDLISRFDVSRDGTHVSVGTFSSTVEYYSLDTTYSANEISRLVLGLPRLKSLTYTDLALEAWWREIYTVRGGVRPYDQGIPRVGLIVTDGRATRAFSHHLPPLRNLGIEIFTIGIGNRIDQSELDLIASTPPSEHVLFLNNIQLINNFISRLTTSSCRSSFPVEGNQGVEGFGTLGQVFYYRLTCVFISRRVRISVDASEGYVSLFASTTSAFPGPFSPSSSTITSASGNSSVKVVDFPVQPTTDNVYVSVGCQAQQTRYRIFMYETLFEDNLIATIDGSAPTGTFVLALQSSYIMDYSDFGISIIDGDEDGMFFLNPTTGQLFTQKSFSLQQIKFVLTVSAVSKTVSCRRSLTTVVISVIHTQNLFPPRIKNFSSHLIVSEHVSLGYLIHDFEIYDSDVGENGQFNVSLIAGNEQGDFILSQSGVLYVAKQLNASHTSQYQLELRAVDFGMPKRPLRHMFLISVIDENDPPSYVQLCAQTNSCTCDITEHASRRSAQCEDKVLAYDFDVNSDFRQIYYKVQSATGKLSLTISNTGVLVVNGDIDRESLTDRDKVLYISISNYQDFRIEMKTILKINIVDVNDNTPRFNSSIFNFLIGEDAQNGSIVGDVTAVDLDVGENGTVAYTIPDQVPFMITQEGEIVVFGIIDRELSDTYIFSISAVDHGVLPLSGLTTVVVTLSDVNDNSPVFSSARYTASIQESSATNAIVATIPVLQAEDSDNGFNGTVSFFLAHTYSNFPFKIVPRTGVIFVGSPRFLDAEDIILYDFQVIARDNGSPVRMATSTITISILDVNDVAPVFVSPTYHFSVAEDVAVGYRFGNVEAFDGDVMPQSVTYFIQGDSPLPFALNSTSGELITTSSLNYENISEYVFTVTSADSGRPSPLFTSSQVFVEVIDIPDTVPVAVSDSLSITVPENLPTNTIIGQVSTKTTDDRFRLINDPSKGNFAIDELSGEIQLVLSLDFEELSFHHFVVQAYNFGDPDLYVNISVFINVTDINDNYPTISGIPAMLQVSEDIGEFNVLFTAHVTDRDSLNVTDISFHLTRKTSSDCTNVRFDIHVNGSVIVGAGGLLNYQDCIFHLSVIVFDFGNDSRSLSTSADCIVSIRDINNHAPIFLSSNPRDIFVLEGTVHSPRIVQLRASDNDSGLNAEISFSIRDCNSYYHCNLSLTSSLQQCIPVSFPHCPISVDNVTGDVYALRDFDHEVASLYILTVLAKDSGSPSLSSSVTLRVSIVDVNDSPLLVATNTSHVSISEDVTQGVLIALITVSDEDNFGVIPDLQCTLQVNPSDFKFYRRQAGSLIYLFTSSGLDYERSQQVDLVAVISDGTFSVQSSINITVLDVNDNPPIFSQSKYIFNISEGVNIGTLVGMVEATDADSFAFDIPQYYLLDSTTFVINNSSGVLRTNSTIDFELNRNYNFSVYVTDGIASESFTASSMIVVNVENINDNPPMIVPPDDIVVLSAMQRDIYNLTVIDADEPYSSPDVVFTLLGFNSSTEGRFSSHYLIIKCSSIGSSLSYSEITVKVILQFSCRHVSFQVHPSSGVISVSTLCSVDFSIIDTVTIGSSIELLCVAEGNEIIKYRWYRGSTLLQSTTGTGVLSLINVSYVEQGIYNCEVSSSVGRLSGTPKELNVHGLPIVESLENITVATGIEVLLECVVFSTTNYTVSWTKDRQLLTSSRRIRIDHTRLTIIGALESHEGIYSCSASNAAGTSTSEPAKITVCDCHDPFSGNFSFTIDRQIVPGSLVGVVESPYQSYFNYLYSITSGNVDGLFSINELNGRIILAQTLGLLEVDHFVLEVFAIDRSQTYSGYTSVTVQVFDINSYAPEFLNHLDVVEVREFLPISSTVVTVEVRDLDEGTNGQISVLLDNTPSSDFFQITSTSLNRWELSTGIIFNASKVSLLYVVLVASDNAEPPATTYYNLTVQIVDVNSPPVFIPLCVQNGNCSFSFLENSTSGSVIGMLPAYDVDLLSFGSLRFSLIGNVPLTINGEGTITLRSPLDFESLPSNILQFDVEVTDGGGASARTTAIATVKDVNDNIPQFSSSVILFDVEESLSPMSIVGTLSATDRDSGSNGLIVYSLQNTSFFKVAPKTGKLILAVKLDYEMETHHFFSVVARDQGDPPFEASTRIQINVIDVNDVPPQLEDVDGCLNVSEETAPNSHIWTAMIRNAVTDVIFGFSMPDTSKKFVIDQENGNITLIQSLDAEMQDLYFLKVTASTFTGGSSLSDSIEVCIRVVDKNDEVPYFVESPYNFTVSNQATSGTDIGAVSAIDADVSVRRNFVQLQYRILSGNEKGFFVINALSGVLSLAHGGNETDIGPYHLLQVAVTDGMHQTTALVILKRSDTNHQVPLFSQGQLFISVTENNGDSVVLANLDFVYVSRYFGTGDIIVFSTVFSTPHLTVIYNSTTTELVLKSMIDRETITNPFLIALTLFSPNSSLSPLECNISVSVEDVNDNHPELYPPGPYQAQIYENATSGSTVMQLNATDADFNDTVFYTMFGYPVLCQSAFGIDESSGLIFTVDETYLKQLYSCQLDIVAHDSGSPSLSTQTELQVTVVDVNDNFPQFDDSILRLYVSESDDISRTVIGYITATDSDRGSNSKITYSIKPGSTIASKSGEGLPNSRVTFTIHSISGGLTASPSLDYEQEDSFLLVVIGTDSGIPPRSSEVNVYINILDYNDNSPVFDKQIYSIHVPEGIPKRTTLLSVHATDLDGPANQQLTYRLVRPNAHIEVDSISGDIYPQYSLDYEQFPVISAAVNVFDGYTYGIAVISIFVDNVNDNTPVFESECSITVKESLEVGATLLSCSAQDEDIGSFGELRYDLLDGDDYGMFTLTPFSAELRLNRPLDYEVQTSFTLTIAATDSGGEQSTALATVYVENVNDNPPVLVGNRTFVIEEISQDRPIHILQLVATDADSADALSSVSYALTSNVTSDVFRRHFSTSISVMDGTGLSSEAIIKVNFAFQCQLVHFEISRLLFPNSLQMLTLCKVELQFTGLQELSGWVNISAIPFGVMPIKDYCWYKNSQLLKCTSQSFLVIKNLTLTDEGVYHMLANALSGSVSSESMILEISILPHLNKLSDILVRYQQSVTFTCWVNNPKRVPISYKWLFNDRELTDYGQNVDLVDGPFHYTIENIDFSSQGVYTCEVNALNSGHRVVQSAALKVYYGASLISLDIEVSNYSYDHYCQVFSIEEYLGEIAEAYSEEASPVIVSYQSTGLCEPDPCYPNPCKNNGRCFIVGNTSHCSCLPEWSGETCETSFDVCMPSNSPCQFNGVCHYTKGLYGCICPPGRTGRSCELISDVCQVDSCPSPEVCIPSLFNTKSFVCTPPTYFKVAINQDFYLSTRGYLPFGDVNASRYQYASNSTEIDLIWRVYDFEMLIRSVLADSNVVLGGRPATTCTPRLVLANGRECEFVVICPGQQHLLLPDQTAVCNALVEHSLFTQCFTPSAPESPIVKNISSGHIQCNFYLQNKNNVSISADKVLDVLETQQTVYINLTEYRILSIDRANNDSDLVNRTSIQSSVDGFPLWVVILFAILLSMLCIVGCIILWCCVFCTKRRRKIVEKQFIVHKTESKQEEDQPKALYYDADFMFELPTLKSRSEISVDQELAGEVVGEEEFYVNPVVMTEDFIVSRPSSNSQSLYTSSSQVIGNQYVFENEAHQATHEKTVRVVNPLSEKHKYTGGSFQRESGGDYVTISESNPLYASTKELLISAAEVVVNTEVVLEDSVVEAHTLSKSHLNGSKDTNDSQSKSTN